MPENQASGRTRNWPKLTPYQRELLVDFVRSKYGDLHIGNRALRTIWRLSAEGMVEGGTANWYSITQRGRDYVRFGMRKKRAK
jgi:hypothetical protein